jgi:Stringent starvation protein B
MMTSSRPYLIRALYDWIVDNQLTPYLLVNADALDVELPRQHVEDGKIVLNVAPRAVDQLTLGNRIVTFNARFRGTSTAVSIPVGAVLAIYARENGQGMLFGEDGDAGPEDPSRGRPRKPNLKVVK